MISSIHETIGGKPYVLKFSTRAQARVERELDGTTSAILRGLGKKYGVNAVAEILAACWNDGKGVEVGVVYDVLDQIGHEKGAQIVSRLVEAAFPASEASGGDKEPGK